MILLDSGLTNFFAGIQLDYLRNDDLLDTWRGRAAEQIVAQEIRVLLDAEWKDKLCYWLRDKKGALAEVDFIWQQGTRIIPIEVKSGTNSHLRSLHSFVNNGLEDIIAVRVWSGAYMVQDVCTPAPDNKPFKLISIPFYYLSQLPSILQRVL